MNREIKIWVPKIEITLPPVSERQKLLYIANDPRCIFHDYRWPYRVGRHKSGEFPVVVARTYFSEKGYKVFISGQAKKMAKFKVDAFCLLNFPTARQKNDQAYHEMTKIFGVKRVENFICIAEQEKKKYGLRRNGGDPDLFVINKNNPSDKFFVEVKAQDFTKKRRYQDKLNKQQHLVFPLIERYLKCQVRLVIVQIFPDPYISNEISWLFI